MPSKYTSNLEHLLTRPMNKNDKKKSFTVLLQQHTEKAAHSFDIALVPKNFFYFHSFI